MKSLLLAFLVLTISSGANARSILYFKTVAKCETAVKVADSEIKINVQEAQDGQSQLVLKLSGQEEVVAIQTKKILPPPMSAGTSLKYEGIDEESQALVTLSIGTRPIKVGKVVGKSSSLTIEGLFEKLAMVCSTVK